MRLVISAVNFTEGGPLTILRGVTRAAAEHFPDWTVYALVHAKGTVDAPGVIEIAYPKSKGSWLRRLWLEWVCFGRLSRILKPDVWLSLHDITPRVDATRQYVYCHNPAPFCTLPIPAERHDRGFMLFRRFYGRLYGILIHRNAAVIVQQQWLRVLFTQRYRVPRVIVAHPDVSKPSVRINALVPRRPMRFFYPALPRVFKNLELLGECAKILEHDTRWKGEIVVTIDGKENAYAAHIHALYGELRTLRFAGIQSPAQMEAQYERCDALLFPSLLETWGLPLTEAKVRGLPILAADLPYAHETVGAYDQIAFFDPASATHLARLMLDLHLGTSDFGMAEGLLPEQPFTTGWKELLHLILVFDSSPAS